MNYRIFYAWQSQNKQTEQYIKEQLRRAKIDFESEGIGIDLIFSPTQEKTGSPDIKFSILEQIKSCDVFIGDLSFIDLENNISNGNVLYEAGIADAFLGEERVILLCDENTIIEDIVFDINHKRVSRINSKQEKSNIKMWIQGALKEADRQRFIKRYAIEKYEDDLTVVLNYFYKYVNMTKKEYYGEACIPSLHEIQREIEQSKYPCFFLYTDFRIIIESLEEKLVRMNTFSHKRIAWNIINIITKLKEYQKFCSQLKYSFVKVNKDVQQYNVYDTKNFFLKNADEFEPNENSVLFTDNIEMYQGDFGIHVMDKRMYKENENYKIDVIQLEKGPQTIMVSKMSQIDPDVVKIVSSLVLNILTAINEYLKFCDLKFEFETRSLIIIKNL